MRSLKEMRLKLRPLTQEEKLEANRFQEVVQILLEFQEHLKQYTRNDPVDEFSKLKQRLKPYLQQPWFGKIHKWIYNQETRIKELNDSLERSRQQDFARIFQTGKRALSQYDSFLQFSKKYGHLTTDIERSESGIDKIFPKSTKHLNNPLFVENPLFFRTTDFVRQFETSDMKALIEIDLNRAVTGLDFPDDTENFQHVVYWFNQLEFSNKSEIEIDTSDMKRALTLKYRKDEKFKELLHYVEEYLSSNNKSYLNKIVPLMNQYPELIDKMNKVRKEVEIVYRGVGDAEAPSKDVALADKNTRFVATSISRHVAERFARSEGHILVNRVANEGWLLTYRIIDKSGIILDTRIFGGIFGEDEIVIDLTKAELEDIEFLESFERD